MSHPYAADIHLDADEMRAPRRRSGPFLTIIAGVLLGLAAIGGWLWWSQEPPNLVARTPPAVPDAPAPQSAAEPHYAVPATDAAPLQANEVPAALDQLLGRRAGAVQTDAFVRRFAATVDNLGRSHAPVALWPIVPTPGRFTVDTGPNGQPVIAAANAQRYTAFVDFATAVDSAAAVRLYARLVPLLQQAYGQLGFPGRSFHDRLVAVIDLLLATPEPAQPVAVQLMEVKGPVPSTRPWVRYEFADPRLEALSAGQKMLVRMGPANERRLKQKLAELRAQLVREAAAR